MGHAVSLENFAELGLELGVVDGVKVELGKQQGDRVNRGCGG